MEIEERPDTQLLLKRAAQLGIRGYRSAEIVGMAMAVGIKLRNPEDLSRIEERARELGISVPDLMRRIKNEPVKGKPVKPKTKQTGMKRRKRQAAVDGGEDLSEGQVETEGQLHEETA